MPSANILDGLEPSIERSGGRLLRKKGVYILQLQGSYGDMGRQHGELAAAVCGDVVAAYIGGLVRKLVAHALPPVATPAAALIKWWFRYRNVAELNGNVREHLAGLSAAYGQDASMAESLFFVPDIFHYLAGRSFSMLAPPPSCSALFACGDATKDGKLLFGRNFDFFGRNVWNANNALIVMRPDRGQRFCWLGALGVSSSGQGFNQSGLIVGLHSNFPGEVSTKGVPIFKIVHDVLAECTTLEEAVARITSRPRLCGLSLFVTDTRARTAAVVGFSARHAEVVRPENNMLVRANHYVTPEMQKFEVGPHPWRFNSLGRYQRIRELLNEKCGTLAESDIPAILSDCMDPFEKKKVLVGNTLAAPHNVQSFVMSPDDDSIWVAHGDLPVCHCPKYLGFRMSALLDGDMDRCSLPDLPGGGQLNETERAALDEYGRAWSEYMDSLDADRAVFHLHRAAELCPDEAVFVRMAGYLLLKSKKYALALPLLKRNAEFPSPNPLTRAEAHVWAGRCLDLMGRRTEALMHYGAAAKLNAPPVSTAAERHLQKPFKPRHLLDVSPEFMVGGALAKY